MGRKLAPISRQQSGDDLKKNISTERNKTGREGGGNNNKPTATTHTHTLKDTHDVDVFTHTHTHTQKRADMTLANGRAAWVSRFSQSDALANPLL